MLKVMTVAAAALALMACAASAAEDFITGVYLQSNELCAKAKGSSLQAVIDDGNTLLTAKGLQSVEYDCEFLQVTKATRAPAWLVNAVCQEPGYLFPDVLSILQMSPTQLDLVSVKPAEPDGGSSNSGSYYLCEGVKLP
jgi:hypothetical protein